MFENDEPSFVISRVAKAYVVYATEIVDVTEDVEVEGTGSVDDTGVTETVDDTGGTEDTEGTEAVKVEGAWSALPKALFESP